MDMGSSTMEMASASATSTGVMASATTAATMDMGTGTCQISMLWNWNTIDACFIAESWHITSKGMFAGSCIGVVLLVMLLEFLRRASREYDRFIINPALRQHQQVKDSSDVDSKTVSPGGQPTHIHIVAAPGQFRPSLVQQVFRALFHMMQFAVAYFIMLLAMYYNGYILISIIIGAFLGAFVFSWESINLSPGGKEEATLCCG